MIGKRKFPEPTGVALEDAVDKAGSSRLTLTQQRMRERAGGERKQ